MPKQNILLIVNPVAGRKKAKTVWHKIVDLLSRNNYTTTIFTTTRKGEAIEIVKFIISTTVRTAAKLPKSRSVT